MTEPLLTVHATALVFGEAGILIRGRSGAGKSRLALGLIAEAERRGWFGRLVGDDRVRLTAVHDRLLMRPHERLRGRIERRGLGIDTVPFVPVAVATLVMDLVPANPTCDTPPRLPRLESLQTSILSLSLHRLFVPERETAADVAFSVIALLRAAARPLDFACDFFRAAQDGAPRRGSPGVWAEPVDRGMDGLNR